MLRIIVLSIFILPHLSGKAQFDTSFAKKNIIICADSLAYGFKQKNWELFARYSNPGMIGALGGKAAFIEYVSAQFSKIPDSAWSKYEPGRVLQVVKTENDLQAVVELNSIVEWQGIRITTTSHLIGESWSNGLYWTFFDSQNDMNVAKTIKPDLSNQLIIPSRDEKKESINSPVQKNRKDPGYQ